MSRRRIVAGATVAAFAALLVAAPSAIASEGSVPSEVTRYATAPDGLVAQLDDLFGVGGDGKGIDFDDTTKVGQLNRVFVFTAAFAAGEATDTPVELSNEWTAPITIADKPVALSTIWINPDSVMPELADFYQDPDLAAALADVPADAYLVRDVPRGAWFTLLGDTLTPVLAGESGVEGETSLDDYQPTVAGGVADPGSPANTGAILSVAIIAAAAIAVIIVLLIPLLRGRPGDPKPAKPARDAAAPVPTAAIEPPAAPAVQPEPPVAEPQPTAPKKPAAPRKPPAAKPATSATAQPASMTAKKPAAKKPTAKKPAAKPTGSSTPKPRTPKPSAE
jgi:hypothetical protein